MLYKFPAHADAWTASPRTRLILLPTLDPLTSLTPLQEIWAYVTLGASSIVTEEITPIVGGLAASQGELGLKRVMIAVAVGSWVATFLLYLLGAWRGRWVRRRWPRVGRYMKRALRAVRRRPWRSALAVRFAFGARLLLPLACGAAHLPLWLYVIASAVSAIVWSVLFTEVGYLFGEAAVTALRRMEHYDQYVVAVLLGVGLVGLLIYRQRRERKRRQTGRDTALYGEEDDADETSANGEMEA